MTDRTPGQAAYELHQSHRERPDDWSRMQAEHQAVWEAIAQAAIDASPPIACTPTAALGGLVSTCPSLLERLGLCAACGFPCSVVDEIAELTADRDEWKQQHENAVACWYAERDRFTAELTAIKEALASEKRNHCETARVITAERDQLTIQYRVAKLDADGQRKRLAKLEEERDQLRAMVAKVRDLGRQWGFGFTALSDLLEAILNGQVEVFEEAMRRSEALLSDRGNLP